MALAKNYDLIKKYDGTYIYKPTPTSYEIDRFNRDFDQYKNKRGKKIKDFGP